MMAGGNPSRPFGLRTKKSGGGVERVTTGLAMPCALSLALMLLAQHASAKKCTGRARQADQ